MNDANANSKSWDKGSTKPEALSDTNPSPLSTIFRISKRKLFIRFTIGTIGLLIGIILLTIALNKIDLTHTIDQLHKANIQYIIIGAVFYFVGYGARILRWYYLSNNRGLKITLWDSTSAVMGSLALNCIIPARLGEFWRVARTSSDRKSLLAPIPLGAMFIERLTDLIAVVLAAAIFVTPTFRWLGASSQYRGWLVGGLVTALVILIGFIYFISLGQLIRIRKVQEWISKLGSGALPRKSDTFALTLLTLVVWLGEFSFLILTLLSVGILVPVLAGYGVAAFYALILAIPISQAGIGQADLGALELLKLNQNIDVNAIGAALIILRLVNFGGVALLGIITTVIDAVFANFGLPKSNDKA